MLGRLALLLLGCAALAASQTSPDLQCPDTERGATGICEEECGSHRECEGKKLCCSNGCGHACMDPVSVNDEDIDPCALMRCHHGCQDGECLPDPETTTTTTAAPATKGQCPDTSGRIGTCDERCSSNADCDNGQLCCSNGCGHACMDPVQPDPDLCANVPCHHGCKNGQCLPAPTSTTSSPTTTTTSTTKTERRCTSHEMCPDSMVCHVPRGCPGDSAADGTVITGHCVQRPVEQICTQEYARVCGCDGKDYSNSCYASAVGVRHQGKCEPSTVTATKTKDNTHPSTPTDELVTATQTGVEFTTTRTGDNTASPATATATATASKTDSTSAAPTATATSDPSTQPATCKSHQECGEGRFCRVRKGCLGDLLSNGDVVQGVCAPVLNVFCAQQYRPVCGCDGQDYSNACHAFNVGVRHQGKCEEGTTPSTTTAGTTTKGDTSMATTTQGSGTGIPSHCVAWYDGCNTCRVVNGRTAACTHRYCKDEYDEPRCIKYDIPRTCAVWFDGCNECHVPLTGGNFECTKKHCDTYEEAKCIRERTTTTSDADTTTSRTPGTKTWTPHTRTPRTETPRTETTTAAGPTSTSPSIPDNCVRWFDGCNTCTVKNGKITGCTKLYCLLREEPRCLEYKPSIPPLCVEWFNGCATCRVRDGKPYSCSRPAGGCDSDTREEPTCKKYLPEDCTVWFDGCNTCHVTEHGLACTRKSCAVRALKEPHCKRKKCGEVLCDLHCSNGFKTDEYGCSKCECRERQCPQVKCASPCEFGYKVDADGCSTCECLAPPSTATATPNTHKTATKIGVRTTTATPPSTTDDCSGFPCPPLPSCPAPPRGCTFKLEYKCGCVVGCGSLNCGMLQAGDQCGHSVRECADGLVCLNNVCSRDPCLDADCKKDEQCTPQSIQCTTTSCQQYACEAKEYCSQDPCAADEECIPSRRQCTTTPCAQYQCVKGDPCDPNPCSNGQVCVKPSTSCADCPAYECVSSTTMATTASASDTGQSTKPPQSSSADSSTRPGTLATINPPETTLTEKAAVLIVGRMSVEAEGELDLSALRVVFMRHLRQVTAAEVLTIELEVLSRSRSTSYELRYTVHLASANKADEVEEGLNGGQVFTSLTSSSTSFAASGIGETSRETNTQGSSGSGGGLSNAAYIGIGVAVGAGVLIVAVVVVVVSRRKNNPSRRVLAADKHDGVTNPVYADFMCTNPVYADATFRNDVDVADDTDI